MNLGLGGKAALVAGSSRGIGLAIAASLLAEGCRVCVTGRDADSLQLAVMSLAKKFGQAAVATFHGDLSLPDSAQEAVTTTVKTFGRIDYLVANLGTGRGESGYFVSADEWERLFRMNLTGSISLSQAAIPHLERQSSSAIVFVASITALEATPAPLPYSAAKAALLNYGKNLSVLLAPKKIRVNCVAPGNMLFEGGTWDLRSKQQPEQVMLMLERQIPMKRFGTPEEIADLVTFLCSERAGFITGACIVADGGQTRGV
jgi:3-oxoacyl-[acyl-carrier protein] reductase